MMLHDVWSWVKSLGLAEHVYMGKMDAKQDKSIGVYNSKHTHVYKTAIGGPDLESYGTKYVTFLVHWNKSPGETEKAATALYEAVRGVREVTVNNKTIKFIQPLYELQDIGTDDAGVYEMVIEAAVIYEKGTGECNESE